MNIEGKVIWQVAAGDTNRNYADVLLDWQLIAMGPGRYGPWPDCKKRLDNEEMSNKKISVIRSFCEDISAGDLIVLRIGTNQIRGVGVVVGDYIWHDAFGDVDGWDLQHIRRVQWFWCGNQEFPTYTVKLGDTVQKLDTLQQQNHTVRNWLQDLTVSENPVPLRKLPQDGLESQNIATVDEIAEFLFDRGVASGSVKALVSEMGDLVRTARWYETMRMTPSEHETVAYLVIPLLRALGWTPQKMGIEWNYVDVALFGFVPRLDQHLVGVVEAKKWGDSCLTAQSQAQRYARGHGTYLCERLIVTDGMRYGLYLRHRHEIEFERWPDAYLNLTRLRWEYPSLGCLGAGAGLQFMAADFQRLDGPNAAWRNIQEMKLTEAMIEQQRTMQTIIETSQTLLPETEE